VFGDVLPQRDCAFSKIGMFPEQTFSGRIVAVPVGILAAGSRVQIQYAVDFILFAELQNPVDFGKSGFVINIRVLIVLEKMIVERDTDGINVKAFQKFKILFIEKRTVKLLPESVRVFFSVSFDNSLMDLRIGSGKSDHEMFEVQPRADAVASEDDFFIPRIEMVVFCPYEVGAQSKLLLCFFNGRFGSITY